MVPTVETYSIDESFLSLGEFNSREVEPLARELGQRILRWVGIPTCVGITPTKTLKKVENFIAKKRPQFAGVCDCDRRPCDRSCCRPCQWKRCGGHRCSLGLKACQAGNPDRGGPGCIGPDNARALMTVTGGRTVYELRGISCMPLELVAPTGKGIVVTKSFGTPVTEWTEALEALASYATRTAEKMRRYKVAADNLFVFMHTTPSTVIRSI